MPQETINGTQNDDLIILSHLPESLTTEYTIYTGHGDDTVRAGSQSDFIDTSKGADTIYAGAGDDIVRSGNHNDYVDAGHGDDYVSAGAGDDVIKGGKGDDHLIGGSGNDTIYGIKGNNLLDGGTGDDTIYLGRQASTAFGGDGNDHLVADLSKGADHTLSGGADADTFEFVGQSTKKSADAVIADFELGIDEFIVAGMTSEVWAQAHADGLTTIAVTQNAAGDAVLDLGHYDSITFDGVALADFTAFFDDLIA